MKSILFLNLLGWCCQVDRLNAILIRSIFSNFLLNLIKIYKRIYLWTQLNNFRTLISAREFITRALLASRANLAEILDILTNEGVGTADGFNVNLAFLNVPKESRVFHSVEVTPKIDDDKSEVYLVDFKAGSNSLHANRSVTPEKLTQTIDSNPFIFSDFEWNEKCIDSTIMCLFLFVLFFLSLCIWFWVKEC